MKRAVRFVRRPGAGEWPGEVPNVEHLRVFDVDALGRLALAVRRGDGDDGLVVWGAVPTVSMVPRKRENFNDGKLSIYATKRTAVVRAGGSSGHVDQPGRAGWRGNLAINRRAHRIRAVLDGRTWWLSGLRLAANQVTRGNDGPKVLTSGLGGLRWRGGDELDLAVAILLLNGIGVSTFIGQTLQP